MVVWARRDAHACCFFLASRLTTMSLDFRKDFVLEINASKLGLGAILSQRQVDNRLHPVAYASRLVSASEANYAITNLETLAVVWVITHFRYYLYGHNVLYSRKAWWGECSSARALAAKSILKAQQNQKDQYD